MIKDIHNQCFLFPITIQDQSSEIETTDEVPDDHEEVESTETDETPQHPTPNETPTETKQGLKLPVKTKRSKKVLYLLISMLGLPTCGGH